ncbi:MAG: hypothetical protein K2X38_20000 [Gemmataceae bacterium]|nr:hypothetical protein [Gemmataceae bacterium]
MRVLPVLDLLSGQVVRGVAGQRETYRPIVSRWTTSAEPLAVAQALRDAYGLTCFYVADLDAILRRQSNIAAVGSLLADGFSLYVDAGIRTLDDALQLPLQLELVIGLETIVGPDELQRLSESVGSNRLIFSLDLKAGVPLAREAWPSSPRAIADLAVALGVRRLLILDLAKVGVGEGLGTDDLCRDLRRASPNLELLAGGGVRGADDLTHLESLGLDAVLVASALHDGRLTPEDVARFR